jgi:hypothetical protein
MLTHFFGKHSHTNAGEVIDRETCIAWFIGREDAGKAWAKDLIF